MKNTLAAAGLAVLLTTLGACSGSGSSTPTSSASASASASSSSSASTSSSASASDTASASSAGSGAAKAISDSIMSSQAAANGSTQFFLMSRADADCIGQGLVDKIGEDQLKKYKMVTDGANGATVGTAKMSAADAKAATDVVFECTDVASMMQKAINKSGSMPKQMRNCVNKALTEENLRSMFSKIFEGKQVAAQKQLTTPLLSCAKG